MNQEIVESFAQMVREKGIDKDILVGIVEDIFGMMVRKKYGPTVKFDVVVNMDKGDIEIYLEREVVEEVVDPVTQIDTKEARKRSGEDIEVGEEFVEIVPLDSFGRRLVVSAKRSSMSTQTRWVRLSSAKSTRFAKERAKYSLFTTRMN